MDVRNSFLLTKLPANALLVTTYMQSAHCRAEVPDDRGHGRVVAVVHPGEEVVLDLVVETPVQLAEPPAAHV